MANNSNPTLNPGDILNSTVPGTGTAVPWMPSRVLLPMPTVPVSVPVKGTVATTTAPQNTSGTGGVPLELLTINAVQSPVIQQSYTDSEVSVSFSRNPSDTNYDHVSIWFVGYHGSSTPTLMASGTTSPISFICDSTGETVTVYAQPIGSTGEFAPLTFALNTTVTLNGVVGAPPQPTITQYVVSTPTGYQFAFDQLVLSVGDEDVIASYNVYRNTSNTTSGATVIRTIKHDPTNNGNPIVVQDIVNRGTVEYYWLSAVNTKGLESSLEACQTSSNTTYEPAVATSNIVSGQDNAPPALSNGTTLTSGYTAGNVVYMPGIVTFDVIVNSPGNDQIVDVLLWYSNTSSKPNGYFFRFDNRSGQNAGQILIVTAGTWATIGTAKASANASRLPVGTYHVFGEWNPDGTLNVYVNGKWQYTAQDTTYSGFITNSNTYYGSEATAPAIAPYIQNWSTFGSGELLSQGSISAAGTTAFTYTSTTTSIKWTWSSFIIYNPDGTQITVPANSSGTTFSGLTPSTTYYFGFYVTMSTGVCTVVLSDTSSGTAASSNAQITQTFNGDGNLGINWNIQAHTTASGGGGGGGGGNGICFSPNTKIVTNEGIKSLGDLKVGDLVLTARWTWRPVLQVRQRWYVGQAFDMGAGEIVTRAHRLLQDGEWKPAYMAGIGSPVSYQGMVISISIDANPEDDGDAADTEHSFTLANGLVAHNQIEYSG